MDALLRDIRRACSTVEKDLSVDVNPVVVDQKRWTTKKEDPFVDQVRAKPLVVIPLEHQS